MNPDGPIVRSRFNTNAWNRIRYRLWAPFYDLLVPFLNPWRKQSLALLAAQPGERILIVGAGTGLDLEFLAPGVQITAIDLTPAMVARLQRRAQRRQLNVDARVMDGQALEFPDGTFDAVILHLILAVIPDPVRCLRESVRVLRPGGRVAILDKFVSDAAAAPLLLRLASPVFGLLATETTRRLGPILEGSGLRAVREKSAGLGGYFKLALLEKP